MHKYFRAVILVGLLSSTNFLLGGSFPTSAETHGATKVKISRFDSSLVGFDLVSPNLNLRHLSKYLLASANLAEKVKFKLDNGAEAFSLKPRENGAKLVDVNGGELARLTVSDNKIKIKDASDRVIGYVVTEAGYWKLKNPGQTRDLFILRRQNDGDYKLENEADAQIYRIKARDYGLEIETPAKQSLYKIKVRDGKISLRDATDRTILSTRSNFLPIAVACFGFDVLNRPQQAALAYAIHLSGGK